MIANRSNGPKLSVRWIGDNTSVFTVEAIQASITLVLFRRTGGPDHSYLRRRSLSYALSAIDGDSRIS